MIGSYGARSDGMVSLLPTELQLHGSTSKLSARTCSISSCRHQPNDWSPLTRLTGEQLTRVESHILVVSGYVRAHSLTGVPIPGALHVTTFPIFLRGIASLNTPNPIASRSDSRWVVAVRMDISTW
jgi:hypothetical protein